MCTETQLLEEGSIPGKSRLLPIMIIFTFVNVMCLMGAESALHYGPNPTLMTPRANWEAEISQNGQKTKQNWPNPGSSGEQRPQIGGDFVEPDSSAKSF